MKTTFKKALAICLVAAGTASCFTGCGSSLGGSSSYEAAIDQFFSKLADGDIEGMKEASAPAAYWEYLEKKEGLTGDRLFYKIFDRDSDSFKEEANACKEVFRDTNASSLIDSTESVEDALRDANFSFSAAGIDSMVDEFLSVDFEKYDIDGYAYHFEDEDCWFFCLESPCQRLLRSDN